MMTQGRKVLNGHEKSTPDCLRLVTNEGAISPVQTGANI